MEGAQFESGAKQRRGARREPLGDEIEIRRFAQRQPAPAEAAHVAARRHPQPGRVTHRPSAKTRTGFPA
jgi:hypothetical protein